MSNNSDTPKILKPLAKTEKKMQPLSEAAFNKLLGKAATQPGPKPAPKHR